MPKLNNVTKQKTKSFLRMPKISDSIPFALIFLAARCSLLGINPFAVSMFCSVFDLKIGYVGLVAAAVGFLSCGISPVKYIPAMMLFWLYSRLRENYREERLLSPVVAGASLLICGTMWLFYTEITFYNIIILAAESVTCAFFYVIFANGRSLLIYSRKKPTEQELISGAVCIGIFISGLTGINIPPGIEISKIISSYAVMTIALNMSISVAGSCGIAAGLICCMNDVNAVILMGLYGLSAIFGNMLKSFGKYGVALGFLGSCAVTMLYIGNSITVSVFEIMCACLLFILTPNYIHKSIGRFINKTARLETSENKMRHYLLNRLSSAGQAFARLAAVYRSATDKKLKMYNRDICTVIDNVTNRVCRGCPDCDRCMGRDKADTYRIIFSLIEILENNGFCNSSNVPGEFKLLCSSSDIFLCELEHTYEIYRRELIRHGDYVHNRDLMLTQYEEVSGIFMQLRDELGEGFKYLPDVERKIADELEKDGFSIREVQVMENGLSEPEVYIAFNNSASKSEAAEKISDILGIDLEYRDMYSGGMMHFCRKPQFEIEYGEKLLTKGDQVISGDTLTSFHVGNDKFYVILCDGMGSGVDAGKESRITGRLLEEFLRDGFSPETAVGIANSSLAVGTENESFSSVDLLCIDLFNGTAEFYKIGSCKSFIKHGNNLETVFSASLPIGILPEIHISSVTKRLEDNDLIIMMSDGAEGYGFLSGEKIRRLIDDDEKSMNEIASAIVEGIGFKKRSYARDDDITVAAIKIKKN